jgi:hypothetical protein
MLPHPPLNFASPSLVNFGDRLVAQSENRQLLWQGRNDMNPVLCDQGLLRCLMGGEHELASVIGGLSSRNLKHQTHHSRPRKADLGLSRAKNI